MVFLTFLISIVLLDLTKEERKQGIYAKKHG